MPIAVDVSRGGRGTTALTPPRAKRTHALAWALAAVSFLFVSGICLASPSEVHITAAAVNGGLVISATRADGRQPAINSFTLDDPPRLVFDLSDSLLPADHPRALEVDAAGVASIRIGQNQPDPPVVRVVVDLAVEGEIPAWDIREGESPGEAAIVVHTGGIPLLTLPEVTPCGEALLVRFAGVGALPRRTGVLSEPPRLFVDLVGAEVSGELTRDFSEGLVSEVRLGQQPEEDGAPVGRLVVELREDAAHSIFEEGTDLVVAVGGEPWALPLPEYRGDKRLQDKTIVVDPGHGGKDTGAQAPRAGGGKGMVLEKDLVLDISQRLARILKAEGAKVVMTRSDDTYLSLQARAEIANRLHADAFVSVHCNSCDRPNTLHGTSVYYDHAHSIALARAVQSELLAALGTYDKGVRNANFAVIRRTRVPGILVETAFINHWGDQKRLLNDNFRERAARAIARGIMDFLGRTGDENAEGE